MCRLIMRLDNSYVLCYRARTMGELDNIIVLFGGLGVVEHGDWIENHFIRDPSCLV